MTGGYTLDPSALTAVAGDLDGAGDTLDGQSSTVQVGPDAGASSGEVADAFKGFGAAATALAQQVSKTAQSLRDSVADYQASDARSGTGFGGGPP